MSTLKTQYEDWIKENPDIPLTYEEWFSKWGELNNLPINFDEIDSEEEVIYEGKEDDLNDWDSTLMDGLEEDDDWDD